MVPMAAADRHPHADLSPRALARAEFFETVRLILAASGRRVGGDTRAADEPVRFHAADGMRHPDTEIVALKRADDAAPLAMTVGFMGLTGPMGVMPDHYTDLAVERRRARDEALGRFLDLFNHRAISLFYRAWAKYRLPVAFAEGGGNLHDPFSRALAAVAGLARTPGDPALLAAAGPLSRRVRSAGALRRLVAATLALPVEVIEMRPRWITIEPSERTRLSACGNGQYAQLGVSAVAGERACDVAGRFRLRIGPLDLATFRAFFTPGGLRERLTETVRFAVGATVDFDIQLVLQGQAVCPVRLGDTEPATTLGRDGWLLAGSATSDRDDTVLTSRPAALPVEAR